MKTIITVESSAKITGDRRELQIVIPQRIGKPPDLCAIGITEDGADAIQVDPKELIEVGEIIKRLYR